MHRLCNQIGLWMLRIGIALSWVGRAVADRVGTCCRRTRIRSRRHLVHALAPLEPQSVQRVGARRGTSRSKRVSARAGRRLCALYTQQYHAGVDYARRRVPHGVGQRAAMRAQIRTASAARCRQALRRSTPFGQAAGAAALPHGSHRGLDGRSLAFYKFIVFTRCHTHSLLQRRVSILCRRDVLDDSTKTTHRTRPTRGPHSYATATPVSAQSVSCSGLAAGSVRRAVT